MEHGVVILGCGPAGLIAAEAVNQFGLPCEILAVKKKSNMPGAQYLHAPVPNFTPKDPDGQLNYIKVGTAEGYGEKVYGSPTHPVSWNSFKEGEHPAWRLGDTYERLWQVHEDRITDMHLNGVDVRHLCHRTQLVISSIPAVSLCRGSRHQFDGVRVWFKGEKIGWCPEDTIVYNGLPEDAWYRTSNIFGISSTEYSVPMDDCYEGFKPTKTDCDCLPDNCLRIGRFGKWDKNALLHHVFDEVTARLAEL